MKVSIIGAGNVGSTLAERVLTHDLADVVLLDIAENLAKAKAYDLLDATPLMGYKKRISGTSDYKETAGSDAVVITAGLPRRPGMSREDLIEKNRQIIESVTRGIKEFSPDSIIIVVTNPLDIMTYLAYKEIGCPRKKILGMAGNLDTARFKTLLSEELDVSPHKIETFVLGSHGDTMVPLVSKTLVEGKPLKEILDDKKISRLLERTKKRGAEIVGLLKTGSAYYSPSAACFEILKAISKNEKKIVPCSCVLEGEYGLKKCAIGVPAKIGKAGVEEILEWKLQDEEFRGLKKSAELVKNALEKLGVEHAGSK